MMRLHRILAAVALVFMAVSGCIPAPASTGQAVTPAATAGSAVEGIQISGAWARVAGGMAMPAASTENPAGNGTPATMQRAPGADHGSGAARNGAAYMTIRNTGAAADRLLSVTSEAAGAVEIHETREEGGMMKMHPVDGVEIPSGSEVGLEPGGFHIMLLGLADVVEPGYTIELELMFEHAGAVRVLAEVRQP